MSKAQYQAVLVAGRLAECEANLCEAMRRGDRGMVVYWSKAAASASLRLERLTGGAAC